MRRLRALGLAGGIGALFHGDYAVTAASPWASYSAYLAGAAVANDPFELESSFDSGSGGTAIEVLDTLGPDGCMEGTAYGGDDPEDVVPDYVDDGSMIIVAEGTVIDHPPDNEAYWQVFGWCNDAPGYPGVEGVAGGIRRNTDETVSYECYDTFGQGDQAVADGPVNVILVPSRDVDIASGLLVANDTSTQYRARDVAGTARRLFVAAGCDTADSDGPHGATVDWWVRAFSLVPDDTWQVLSADITLGTPTLDAGGILVSAASGELGTAVEVSEDATLRPGVRLAASWSLGELADAVDNYVADGTMAILVHGEIVSSPGDNVDYWQTLGVAAGPPDATVQAACLGFCRTAAADLSCVNYGNGIVVQGNALVDGEIRGVILPARDADRAGAVMMQEDSGLNGVAIGTSSEGPQHLILSAACNSAGSSGDFAATVLWKVKAVRIRR